MNLWRRSCCATNVVTDGNSVKTSAKSERTAALWFTPHTWLENWRSFRFLPFKLVRKDCACFFFLKDHHQNKKKVEQLECNIFYNTSRDCRFNCHLSWKMTKYWRLSSATTTRTKELWPTKNARYNIWTQYIVVIKGWGLNVQWGIEWAENVEQGRFAK